MADDAVYADLLDSLSPLTKNGIDPDQARMDRAATMAKLMGSDVAAPPSWLDAAQSPQDPPASGPAITGRVQPSTPDQPPPSAQPPAPAQSAVPASVTPNGKQADPSLAAGNASTIGLMRSDYAKASQDVSNEASQPGIDTTTAALEAQRSKDATPINAYDPTTGKVLAPYKPSIGQRIMRGAEGVLRGGVLTPQAILGAIDPKAVGGTAYGAPTAQYGRDVEQQQSKVASDDQQLKNAADNWKATSERLKQVAADRRSLATTGKDVTGASIAQQGVPIDQQKADADTQNAASATARAYNDSPEAKAATTEAQFQAAQQKADQLGLKGQQRTLFLANGKIPDPRQATDDEIATGQATRAFTQEHGHPPQTLAEYSAVRAAAKGQPAGGASTSPGGPVSPAAKAVMDGRTALPSANSRAPGAQQLRAEVFANDPSYDETKYPTYKATRQNFTSGSAGIGINFIKTAGRHLDELEKNIPDNVDIPLVGSAINWAKNSATRATSPQLKAFEAARNAVSSEVAKAYAGKAITQGEHDQMEALINESDSPKALRSGIQEFRKLLDGKKQGYREQWQSGMPSGAVSPLSTLEEPGGGGGAQAGADHDIVVNPEDMH